jgi:hypothetical protein
MDLACERGLRQMQLCGGFGEIQDFRHGHEITQVTQFHILTGSLAILVALATGNASSAQRLGALDSHSLKVSPLHFLSIGVGASTG